MITHALANSKAVGGRAAALLFVLMLTASAALAAAPERPPADPDDPVKPAAELRVEAVAIIERTGDLAEAADFLVETAADLDPRDVEKARNLRVAGRYYHHAGDLEAAYEAMLAAGQAAYAAGDYSLAADVLLDAGIAAAEDGKQGAAWRAAHKAGYVLRTQSFTPEERLRILGRVVYLPSPVLEEPGLATDSEDGGDEG